MSKILIICDVYPPSFAPRMGYLVKYMKELGWTADIITREQDRDKSFQSLLGKEKVIRVGGKYVYTNGPFGVLNKLITLKKVHKKNVRLITNKILTELSPDHYKLILCSTAHRTFILEIASQVAKTWNKPWIADIRDISEQTPSTLTTKGIKEMIINYFNNKYKKYSLALRNKNLQQADMVVTITPWHVEQLKKFNKDVHLIYNGFCPELFFPKPLKKQDKFIVSYLGLIISKEYRDPTLLFLAVQKLRERELINDNFRIQFYTPENKRNPILENSAYNKISDLVDFFEYIDTSKVPQVLADSSILLLLTNVFKKEGPRGIMTTKYFEYLAMERPILCVRSDENILETSITKANAGLSARTVEETCNFLLDKWREWEKEGFTTVDINRDYTQQFSRKIQAEQFVELFNKIIV